SIGRTRCSGRRSFVDSWPCDRRAEKNRHSLRRLSGKKPAQPAEKAEVFRHSLRKALLQVQKEKPLEAAKVPYIGIYRARRLPLRTPPALQVVSSRPRRAKALAAVNTLPAGWTSP